MGGNQSSQQAKDAALVALSAHKRMQVSEARVLELEKELAACLSRPALVRSELRDLGRQVRGRALHRGEDTPKAAKADEETRYYDEYSGEYRFGSSRKLYYGEKGGVFYVTKRGYKKYVK